MILGELVSSLARVSGRGPPCKLKQKLEKKSTIFSDIAALYKISQRVCQDQLTASDKEGIIICVLASKAEARGQAIFWWGGFFFLSGPSSFI